MKQPQSKPDHLGAKEPQKQPQHDGTIQSHEVPHTHGHDRDRELRNPPVDDTPPAPQPEIVQPKGHKPIQ